MVEESVFTANTSQVRVWSLLADLRGYSQWHPQYSLVRQCKKGCHAQLSRRFSRRHLEIRVDVERGQKPRMFGWTSRFNKGFAIDERYEIAAIKHGSEIRHIVEFKGLFGNIAGRLARRYIREEMAAQDAALLRALKKQAFKPIQGIGHSRSAPPTRGDGK